MIDPIQIIERYYPTDTLGYRILLIHSQQVAELALEVVRAERHTGTGLDSETIRTRGLDLPTDRLYMPQSIEERVICYADKFYSKSQIEHQKPLEKVRTSLAKYGADSLARFDEMHEQFQVPSTLV